MVCARRTGEGRVPWLGGPGRRELAFNGIFEPPKVRARRAPRLALPGRCERLTMRSLSGAARPAHPVGWLAAFLRVARPPSAQPTGRAPRAVRTTPSRALMWCAAAPRTRNQRPTALFTLRSPSAGCLPRAASTRLRQSMASPAVVEGGGGRGGAGGARRAPAAPPAADRAAARARSER